MKKLLIIALLFVGCGIFEKENANICAIEMNYILTDEQIGDGQGHARTSISCWNDLSEALCINKRNEMYEQFACDFDNDEDCSMWNVPHIVEYDNDETCEMFCEGRNYTSYYDNDSTNVANVNTCYVKIIQGNN